MLRILLISTVSSIALATTALAADLPNEKGPAPFMPPPPPLFSWTGFYIGANAGLSAGDFDLDERTYPGGVSDYEGSYGARSSGFSGGGQVGVNYEFQNNIVIGAEADFQGSTLNGTYANSAGPGGAFESWHSQVQWWGTVRGRLGYAFGNLLPYVIGGFAYGRTTDDYSSSTSHTNASGSHAGWTVGAGLEYALTRNVTVKVEYLYTDLGTQGIGYDLEDGEYEIDRIHTQFSTVRAGLNWKFDWFAPPAPVVARY